MQFITLCYIPYHIFIVLWCHKRCISHKDGRLWQSTSHSVNHSWCVSEHIQFQFRSLICTYSLWSPTVYHQNRIVFTEEEKIQYACSLNRAFIWKSPYGHFTTLHVTSSIYSSPLWMIILGNYRLLHTVWQHCDPAVSVMEFSLSQSSVH
jgi:hypothetical protein